MTEDEAKHWIVDQFNVSRGTLASLEHLVALISAENAHQNLVAPSSLLQAWARHITDSTQLLRWGAPDGLWIDVGSGAGLPGLVIAILRNAPTLLVEPRRKRADFITKAAEALKLKHVEVVQRDIRKVSIPARVISARAVAPLDSLLTMTIHLSRNDTIYILPKGRTAVEELEHAHDTWQGVFHVEQSVTDSESKIIIATNVARRSR